MIVNYIWGFFCSQVTLNDLWQLSPLANKENLHTESGSNVGENHSEKKYCLFDCQGYLL